MPVYNLTTINTTIDTRKKYTPIGITIIKFDTTNNNILNNIKIYTPDDVDFDITQDIFLIRLVDIDKNEDETIITSKFIVYINYEKIPLIEQPFWSAEYINCIIFYSDYNDEDINPGHDIFILNSIFTNKLIIDEDEPVSPNTKYYQYQIVIRTNRYLQQQEYIKENMLSSQLSIRYLSIYEGTVNEIIDNILT